MKSTKQNMVVNENNDFESNLYFYHPDHLGSSNYITDRDGNAVQHLLYMPFGEQFVSEATGDFDSRYKFSGKELDDETGYNYFGARYYDSDLSNWLSVDPMSDKYPSLSPYNYCVWNPMKFIDINGEGPGDIFESTDQAAIDWGNTYNDNSIAENKEYSSVIFKVVDAKGVKHYTYTAPNVGKKDEVKPNTEGTKRKDRVAEIHSHGSYDLEYDNSKGGNKKAEAKDFNNEFSYEDELRVKDTKKTSYLATPSGELKNFDPKIHKAEESRSVSKDLPSDDMNKNTRVNNNDYKAYPKSEPVNNGTLP